MFGILSFLLSCNVEMERQSDSVALNIQKVVNYQARGLQKSHQSSVKIDVYAEEPFYGSGSGNYFIFNGKYFILTAAHIIQGAEIVVVNERFGIEKIVCNPIYVDEVNDLAILVPNHKMKTVKPARYTVGDTMQRGDEVFFTGYPSELEEISSVGTVAGQYYGYYVIQSMAWMGSSGSVVFNKKGKVVGVVSAIKVGWTSLGIPQLIDTMVLVTPMRVLNKNELRDILKDGGI